MSMESTILAEVKAALNRLDGLTVWRNTGGFDEERKIRYGLCPGSSDLVGVMMVRGVGVALFVETKSATGRMEVDQRTFRGVVERLGAVYIVARSTSEAILQASLASGRVGRRMRAEP